MMQVDKVEQRIRMQFLMIIWVGSIHSVRGIDFRHISRVDLVDEISDEDYRVLKPRVLEYLIDSNQIKKESLSMGESYKILPTGLITLFPHLQA